LGGITWCILNISTDIDIYFEDNMKLGDKTKLCEIIIKSLNNIKCPVELFPHQISGLDFEKCYNVIQWLVKNI
jgi:hypothetical protein